MWLSVFVIMFTCHHLTVACPNETNERTIGVVPHENGPPVKETKGATSSQPHECM